MDATTLAHELVGIQESAHLVPPFSVRHPGLTAEQGYAAARKLHAHRCARGWQPVGRKIGFTNRTLWQRYGVHEPMWGTVYDHTIIFSERNRATVPLAGLAQPRIEPEICFKLKSAPPRSGDPQALLAAIEWVAHSVEIVQCHHPEWKVTIADCTTDNGLHGRLVVGAPVQIREIPDLASLLPLLKVTLKKENEVKDQGVGANVLGSPLASLAFLVEVLAQQPESPPLAAGEIITTGVLTDAHPVKPGEKWSTSFEGISLPGMEIDFQ
ncbi:MAG: decarboxylase [Betaproteobacteria bacterium]|nr:decarboxylase [Betaproteobacteria bacterium]